jgi:hypothetical protein
MPYIILFTEVPRLWFMTKKIKRDADGTALFVNFIRTSFFIICIVFYSTVMSYFLGHKLFAEHHGSD